MTLKFNDELIINGTEWTYPTFRFDIDTITPTSGGQPQPTSSNKVRTWAVITTGNTSTGDAEGFILGQNDFSIQKGTGTNAELNIYADNWENVDKIEFTYDNQPTVNWVYIDSGSTHPSVHITSENQKCTISFENFTADDKAKIYYVYVRHSSAITLSNFKVLNRNGKNITSNISTGNLYLPNGELGKGFAGWDMQGKLHAIKQGSYSGTPQNYFNKIIEGINTAKKINIHTEFTLESALGTSGRIRLIALKGNSSNSYSILYLQTKNGTPNTLEFGAEPNDGSSDTLVAMISDFSSREGHNFIADLGWNNGEITCIVRDITADETFTQTLSFPQLHTDIADGFVITPSITTNTGAITIDLLNTYCKADDVLGWNPLIKVKKSDVNNAGLIDNSYIATLADGNNVTDGILDLSHTGTNASYLGTIYNIGNLFNIVNNKNLWGDNNSCVIRFKVPSNLTALDNKRFFGLVRIYAQYSAYTTGSQSINVYGVQTDSYRSYNISYTPTRDVDVELYLRNYETKLTVTTYEVKTGKLLQRNSWTMESFTPDVFGTFYFGNPSTSESLQLPVDLKHTYTTKQGHLNWTASPLAIK